MLGQVWYLIISIPDLCTLTYFDNWFCNKAYQSQYFMVIKFINLK